MSRDNWSPDSRRWGYYAEDDEDEGFPTRRDAPAPARNFETPARPQPAPTGPDPVVVAQQLAGALEAQSNSYPGISWAVSVLERAGRATFYATSNEGSGYLPPGLRWDPRLGHVLGPAVVRTELPMWLGLANPARIVADHFVFLRQMRPGLRLTAIVSTQPAGEAVTTFLSGLGGVWLPPADQPERPNTMSRLDAVSDGTFAALIAGIPVRQLWIAGLDLALDAAKRCEYRRLEPQLAAVLDGLLAGTAHPAHADHAWQRLWQLTAQAQASRVPDTRLSPLDPGSASLTFKQAITIGAGFAYVRPFFAARTTAILHALLRCRLADEPLGEDQLAELVYEHACVADGTAPARALLARHSTTGDDDL